MTNEMPWFEFHSAKYAPLVFALNAEQRSNLLLAIINLATTGEVIELDPMTNMVFLLVKSDYDASVDKLAQKREQGRAAAIKRWESMPTHADPCEPMPTHAEQ